MKKRLALFLTLVCAICMTSCGNEKDTKSNLKDEKEVAEVVEKEIETSSSVKDGLIFTTEYTIEDYCHGRFLVSKSDGLLEGALDCMGEEVIPVKYDKVSFVNESEITEGVDEELFLQKQYEGEYELVNCDDKKLAEASQRFDRASYLLGQPDKSSYYFYNLNEGVLSLYAKDGTTVSEINDLKIFLSDMRCVEWISKDYFLAVTGNDMGFISLYDKNGKLVKEISQCGFIMGEKVEDKFLFISYEQQDGLGVREVLNSVDEQGNVETLGYVDENQEYDVKYGSYGTSISINKKGEMENEDSEDLYYLGENKDIKLYKSNRTWKLENEQGEPLYDERYYKCYEKKGCYLLMNEDEQICIVDRNGKRLMDYGWLTKHGGNYYFNDKSIDSDQFIVGDNAICFLIPNGDKTDVYYFSGEN